MYECPECEVDLVGGNSHEVGTDCITYHWRCPECGEEYEEIYTLTGLRKKDESEFIWES